MKVAAFLKRLAADNTRKKNTHKLNKPAAEGAIEKFLKKHPEFKKLPKSFVEFLEATDGVTILVDKTALAEVGGRMRLLGIKKLDTASKIMFGDEELEEEGTIPPHWIGLGWDDNHDWSPVLDSKTGEVRIASHIGSDDSDEVFDSFEDFLDWVSETMLDVHDEDVAAEAEAKKKPKGGKKGKVAELELIAEIHAASDRILGMSVSHDGARAVTYTIGDAEGQVEFEDRRVLRLWDLKNHGAVRAFDVPSEQTQYERVNADKTYSYIDFTRECPVPGAALSADGRVVAASPTYCVKVDEENTETPLIFFDANSGKELGRAATLEARGSVQFSPDGRYVLADGGPYIITEGGMYLFDAKKFKLIKAWETHKPRTVAALFTPDSKRIISSGWNKVIRVWDVPSGELADELPRQKGPIFGLAISSDGKRLALGGYSDRVVRVMDLKTKKSVAEMGGHTQGVQGLSFSPDDARLATIDGKGCVRVWDSASSAEIAQFVQPHKEGYVGDPPGTGVVILPDGETLASCGWDGKLRILKMP